MKYTTSPMVHRKKIIEEVLHNMHIMKHKLVVTYHNKKEITITPSQGFVLRFVAENNTTNVGAIARALHITSSAATQLIDCLVDKGYLIRKNHPHDRRVSTLSLSTKANRLFNEFKEQSLEKMTELLGILSDKELVQYATLNKKIIENIIHKKS